MANRVRPARRPAHRPAKLSPAGQAAVRAFVFAVRTRSLSVHYDGKWLSADRDEAAEWLDWVEFLSLLPPSRPNQIAEGVGRCRLEIGRTAVIDSASIELDRPSDRALVHFRRRDELTTGAGSLHLELTAARLAVWIERRYGVRLHRSNVWRAFLGG